MQNEPKPYLSGTSLLAILSVVLAAGWIAFAYYKGSSSEDTPMLLHPIVPILLTVLLTRVYHWIDIKSIIVLEILMISVWLFIHLLSVLMPFILGFVQAYIIRFLWNALPFKKNYQRGIVAVLIVLICGFGLFHTGKQVSKQITQMSNGLLKFYHEIALPYVVGETFQAFTVVEGDKKPPTVVETHDQKRSISARTSEAFYLGTNHGVYEIQQNAMNVQSRIGITNGALLGKSIQALAAGENVIYAGTRSGLYRYYKTSPVSDIDGIDMQPPKVWQKVKGPPFDSISVQSLNIPNWDHTQIYVGTQKGLYKSRDSGQTWEEVTPELHDERSILSVISIVDRNGDRIIYVVSTRNPDSEVPEKDSPEQTVSAASATTIHWHLEESNLGWTLVSPTNQVVYVIAGDSETLYAGTSDGLYEWDRSSGHLEKIEETASMPLLASASAGLYAGNHFRIQYRDVTTKQWQPFVTYKVGITYSYKDEPIFQQMKVYLTERIPTITQSGGEVIRWASKFASSIAFGFGGFLFTTSVAFIVSVYASQSFDEYFRGFIKLVPEPYRESGKTYLREIDENLQKFLKGQVAVIAIVSTISCIAYSIIGVPFALAIGLLAGICNAIPTFGPFIGGGLAFIGMLMGLAAGDFGIIDFLIRNAFVLGAILGIQMLDNSFISPKIMGTAVNVDPLLILFAVIVGATVLGFWGVLLAVPIIVVIKSIISVSTSIAPEER